MARLSLSDVQNGRAIPQIGDIVGNLQYRGGDPSDLSRYYPLDGSAPQTGSIYDINQPLVRTAAAPWGASAPGTASTTASSPPSSDIPPTKGPFQPSPVDPSQFTPEAFRKSLLRERGLTDADLNLRSRRDHYPVPDPSGLPDTTYTDEQLQQAIAQAQAFDKPGGSEWATSYFRWQVVAMAEGESQ